MVIAGASLLIELELHTTGDAVDKTAASRRFQTLEPTTDLPFSKHDRPVMTNDPICYDVQKQSTPLL